MQLSPTPEDAVGQPLSLISGNMIAETLLMQGVSGVVLPLSIARCGTEAAL